MLKFKRPVQTFKMFKRTHAQRKVYPKCSMSQLPDDLLMRIFRFLPRYAILPATEVCSRWYGLISGSDLLHNFTVRIDLSMLDENSTMEYEYFLNRSNRCYRKLLIVIRDHRSFVVAVMALRKFGPHLTDLCLTLDHRCVYPSFVQLHYHRMKDIEMGLEEYQQMLWEQEIDSYDRCLLMIALPKEKPPRPQPNLWQDEIQYRRIEEVFLAFMYRQCQQLERLRIKRVKNYRDTRTKTLLYVGVEMERLKELEIDGTGLIVLSESFLLRKLTVQGVTAGRPFYAGFRNAFPLLTHLEIGNDMQFDNPCLWEICKRCPNLEELIFVSDRITKDGFTYTHRLSRLRKLSITLNGKLPECRFEGCEALPVENLFVCSNELPVETIQATLIRNEKMKEFVIRTKRCIEYSMLNRLQQIRPTCRLTYTQMTV